MRRKIVTACSQGLCRSVGLADVLKLHFEPVDVIPVGMNSNSPETIRMLAEWCDVFITMTPNLGRKLPQEFQHKLMVCDVGQDRYKSSKHPELIDQVWRWTRANIQKLGITEHFRKI